MNAHRVLRHLRRGRGTQQRTAHVRWAFTRARGLSSSVVEWWLFTRWDQRPFVAYVLRDARVVVIER